MIVLTFNQNSPFVVSDLPDKWLERINVRQSGNVYSVSIDVDVEDSSYRYRSIMSRPQLVLKFSLPYFVEFPVGTSCVFQNQTFSLNNPENLKKQGNRDIEYTMTLGTIEDHLAMYKLRNSIDGRLKWSMCAKPHEFIEEIIKALNARDGAGVWFSDRANIIEATEKTIEFNHVYCDAALASVAETFETEYEIIDHNNGKFEIALRKVEYFKDSPLPLSYGRGNGFIPGVGRSTELEGTPVKRLYVQGGDRNIDRSQYGAMFGYSNNPGELRLPKAQTVQHEGRTYRSDDEGYYIERSDKVSTAIKEDSLDCSEIYPSYVGTVSKVETIDKEKNFYDIIDSSIPANLDFNKYIIEGESMTIIFQTGMLAGREFDVKYKHEERRWELVPMEEDGITMPDNVFCPVSGNTYAVFGIMLPKEYICDDASKTGAAWDMMREAARFLYENEEQKFTFAGELQALYAKRNWLQIGGYLKIGAYIHFTDNQFAKEGVDIRIIGIKDYVNTPYSPTLEISNSIQSPTSVSSQLRDIDKAEVTMDDNKKSLVQFTKRRFRDAQETITMLEEALLDNFTNSITPIAVQTMSALVGDESLQFEFGRYSGSTWITVSALFNYDQTAKKLKGEMSVSGSKVYLKHLTIGVNSVTTKTGRENSDIQKYLTWPMKTYESPVLDDPEKRYYFYARVSRTNTNEEGTFKLSDKAIKMEEEAGYYHLLVGFLNSEYDDERSFVTMYGFTEILPGRITTDRIVSQNGESFLDLVENSFKLGSRLQFNINKDGRLILNGTLVQSSSGDTEYLPCYRGVFNSTYTYYQGDEVIYTSNNVTSLYRCISPVPIRGLVPTYTSYWSVQAQGQRGNFVSRVFIRSNSSSMATPTGGTYESPVPTSPSGWSDGIPSGSAILWSSVCTFYGGGGSSGWSKPAQETDTDTLDIEFSPKATQPAAPNKSKPTDVATNDWYDPSSTDFSSHGTMIWRAERKVSNGEYEANSSWTITRIYGEKGDTGNYSELRYAANGSPTDAPNLTKTAANPSGWTTTLPTVGTGQYLWMTKAVKTAAGSLVENWSDPVRISGEKGKDGENGDSPVMVFRGEYREGGTVYYGNKKRLDCVKYGNAYYITRIDVADFHDKYASVDEFGAFVNIEPTNTDIWNPFGASFESVATELLLAENANIANFIFRNERMESQTQTLDGIPNIILDGKKAIAWVNGSIINPFKRIEKDNLKDYITQSADDFTPYYIDIEKTGLKVMINFTQKEFLEAANNNPLANSILYAPGKLRYAGAELELYNASSETFGLSGPLINTLWDQYDPSTNVTTSIMVQSREYRRYRCLALQKSKYQSLKPGVLDGDFYIVWVLMESKIL